MFKIVPVTKADYEQWLGLWRGYLDFYETKLNPEVTATTFDRILAGEIHGAVAKDELGNCLGLVHWLTHNSTWAKAEVCYLEDLFVAELARGEGFGEALIEHVKTWAKSNNLNKVYWLTAETNTRARRLYDQIASRTGFIHYEIPIK
jgi:GNAT superfamily N-acetyltransferase